MLVRVTTSVPDPPATEPEARAQVGASVGLEIVVDTAQVRPTEEANPDAGDTVIVAVLPEVSPAPNVIGPLLLSE